ncbi:MAG TPA: hypothetical protein VMB27_15045 [Solirubrobacteraceae bacterium]|nr:hypothetical protein [Solirubrobacteraceae bacterium]
MHRSLKRNLVIGFAALALAAFAGGAYAATQNSGPTTRQAFLNDVAKRLGVTPAQLTAALNGATVDQLQAAVKAGHLTQAQANALAQRLKNGQVPGFPLGPVGPLVPKVAPYGPGGHMGVPGLKPYSIPAPAPGLGPGPRFGLGAGFGAFGAIPAAASFLGLTNAQLFQQLSSGKSLAQIATAKGKSVSDLEQAMTTAEKKSLDKLVSAKAITQAQETQILKQWSSNLSKRVNSKGLGGPPSPLFRLFKMRPARPMVPGYAVPAPKAQPGALPKSQVVPAPTAVPVPAA